MARYCCLIDRADAGRIAELDVVEQAWTRIVPGDHAVTGQIGEGFTERLQRVLHCPHRHVGTEIAAAVVDHPARRLDFGERVLPRDADVRVLLVILEADVVVRAVALDQRLFEDQRLDLVLLDDEVDVADVLAQLHGFEAALGAGVEVATHAIPQPLRLADVDNLAALVLHQVDAGLERQIFEDRLNVLRGCESHRFMVNFAS